MNQYLIEYFIYNDRANKKLLETILGLPEKTEAIRLFSHLISSQDKWYNRISKQRDDNDLEWFGEISAEQQLAEGWQESYTKWHTLLATCAPEELDEYVFFTRKADGKKMKVRIKDIVFQLNCHSVHHRAQINKLISAQGVVVPATDYIFTAISEAE